MIRTLLYCFVLLLANNCYANVQLPRIFGDHMVLQREKPIIIWGWAGPKEKISVQFNGQSKSTTTGKNGEWRITLSPQVAGGPFQLVVKGKNTITLTDILIGDVWVCSGQSNMEWTLANTLNSTEEIRRAQFPTIRHIKIPNTVASEPQTDIKGGEWKICNPHNAADFTAVGYFFARELTKNINVPIGLINTTWGGTHSETWTSRKAFEESDEFKDMIKGLPNMNLDSLAKQKESETIARLEKLQGGLPKNQAEIDSWKTIDFNDAQWRKLKIPGHWEGQELGEFDGTVWIRKIITLTAEDASKPAVLDLGMIDDSDETYVNGTKVGWMNQKWNEKRSYPIPSGLLKAGKNVIAVRIEDTGGGGGVYGEPSMVNLRLGNTNMSLTGAWNYHVESALRGAGSVGPNSYPTLLFNAMLNPLLSLGIKGVIWYQGESNAGRAYQYRKAFPLMIADWRKHFNQGDFPFYFVQLASYNSANGNSENGSGWAELREAQAMTLALPNTGMAVTTDIGDPGDIHPRNKQDVGKRLAALALSRTYGKNILDNGPVYKSMEVNDGKAILTFENIGSGFMVKDRYGYIRGFEIAGSDKKFHYAKAQIEGNKIVVYHEDVKNPEAVRYGWADDASDCNLYNVEGFPAPPFRTDTWRGITEGGKFSFN
jgi:sialate O-acetylesterase